MSPDRLGLPPNSTAYFLGIDLGTSSVKAALFEADSFALAAEASREYPVVHPRPSFAEQKPSQWWRSTVKAVRAVLQQAGGGHVQGIGLDGQMHGLVCVDDERRPVQPAIIWADTRATAETQELAARHREWDVIMPGPPAAGFAATSALWLSRHRPEILAATRTILCPKDYLRLCLTGSPATDPSDASGTWLFDIRRNDWALEVAEYCGLRAAQLPPIQQSAALAAGLSAAAAKTLGLRAGTPVVAGSADMPAQALGHGIIEPQTILATVGTGGQIFVPLRAPHTDDAGRFHLFRHNVPDRWYALAAILAGGLSLRWLRAALGMASKPDAYDHLSALAADVPAGAQGLLFLPYLAGERTPHMDPQAAGAFIGLKLHHETGHLARAVMEGVGFALKECLDLVDDGFSSITLSGGVTQSAVWPQILADIWQRPLTIPAQEIPRACLGAAILAAVGAGQYDSAREALSQRSEPLLVIQPNESSLYADRFAQFRRLYPLLREEMHALSEVAKIG